MKKIVALAVAIALAAIGCRKKEPTAAAKSDAGAPDAAAVALAEVPFALVAEGPHVVTAEQTSDGRIVVIAGAMLYEAKPNGVLEPVLAPSELAKLIVDDETLTGYSTTRAIREAKGALGGTLVLPVFGETPLPEVFTLSNGKLARVYEPSPEAAQPVYLGEPIGFRGHIMAVDGMNGQLTWVDHSDAPLPSVPAGVNLLELRFVHGPNGSIVGMERWSAARKLVVWPDRGEPVAIPFPSDVTGCTSIPSFAGKVTIGCGPVAYALEGQTWVKSYTRETPDLSATGAKVSQDAAGAFHVATDRSIARCLGDGPCSTRQLPDTTLTRVGSYDLSGTEFARSETSSAWQRLTVEDVGASDVWGGVEQIFARDPNDVWVFARRGGRIQIFHTSPAPPKPKMLPSVADARVALRDTRPPARWTSSCDQVYVRLGGDADAIKKREAEIRAAVGAKEEEYLDPLPWALVVGQIESERSVGVVLSRHDPLQKISVLETAAKRLVKSFTNGPNEPAVYCSLPVLERKLLPEWR